MSYVIQVPPSRKAAATSQGSPVGTPPPSGPRNPRVADDDGGYRELVLQARRARLFERPKWRPLLRGAVIGSLYCTGWVLVFVVGDSWYQLVLAASLAVVFAHLAFFGHDIGHRQISRSHRLNRTMGLVCGNLGSGISYSYWVNKHTLHHAHPNQVGTDPDIGPGVISWTPDQAVARTGLAKAIARHQAALFFPLTSLEAISLHIASVRSLLSGTRGKTRGEPFLLAAHCTAYLLIMWLAMSPVRALAFMAVQQGVFGLYLGFAFAPNHKGMPMLEPRQSVSFVRQQVATSRNVKGGRTLTFLLGGLNYQIEHHLFPTMPMANLRRCRPIVQAYCGSHNIDYCETGLVRSYMVALGHLRHISRAGRDDDIDGAPGQGQSFSVKS